MIISANYKRIFSWEYEKRFFLFQIYPNKMHFGSNAANTPTRFIASDDTLFNLWIELNTTTSRKRRLTAPFGCVFGVQLGLQQMQVTNLQLSYHHQCIITGALMIIISASSRMYWWSSSVHHHYHHHHRYWLCIYWTEVDTRALGVFFRNCAYNKGHISSKIEKILSSKKIKISKNCLDYRCIFLFKWLFWI